MSASHSIIMLPGAWESEQESYRLGQQISQALGEMPIDIARRMRTTGFAVNGIKGEVAEQVLAAILAAGHEAARVPDRRSFWTYPELRIAGRVAFEGEEIDYEAGSYQETVVASDLLFLHVAWFSKQKGETPDRPTRMGTTRHVLYLRDATATEGPPKSESICLDLHMSTPRMILRMDLKNTRYCFPEEGESTFIFARPSQVFAGLARFVGDRLVLPDLRMLTDRLDSSVWDWADLDDQGALRSRGTWYRHLAENDLLPRTLEILKQQVRDRIRRTGSAPAAEPGPSLTPTLDSIANPYRDQLDTVDRWIKRGLKNRAMKEAEKAIAMKPDRHEGYRARAKVHMAMGDQVAADQDMAKADQLESAS